MKSKIFEWFKPHRKIAELEVEKELRLKIIEVREENYQQAGRVFGLVIENEEADIAEGCRGELTEIEFANLKSEMTAFRWPVICPLTWSEEEYTLSVTQPLKIYGKSRKVLNLIIFRYVDGRPVVEIAYKNNQFLRISQQITNFKDIYMVISATSLNRLPIYAVCRYRNAGDTRWNQKLELCDVTKDKPTISSYRQSK